MAEGLTDGMGGVVYPESRGRNRVIGGLVVVWVIAIGVLFWLSMGKSRGKHG